MKLVTRNHIERWAETTFSKPDLPFLILRLVRATTPQSTWANFPSGSAAYIGGWDGDVNCQEDTFYVPKGISLYEFGTEADSKGKADDDYDKRTADPLGYNPQDCVFTFITARFWKMKDKWIKTKKAEGVWKDVRVYDSSILEQWLDQALAVSRWFSSQPGVEAYPFDGIMTAEEFWEEWSMGPNGLKLLPEVIAGGREYEQKVLLSILQGPPSIKAVKASTKAEAIAFIIASAKLFPNTDSERFFSKSIVIDTEANFRGIKNNSLTYLNIIPRFNETLPLHSAVAKGHHVLIPLGANDSFSQETIIRPLINEGTDDSLNQDALILSTINRDHQIDSLIKSGLKKEVAEKLSREAGRNITVLKKLLGFLHVKSKWLNKENIQEIIPILLLGRWNDSFIGDVELIEKLSHHQYSDYQVILNKWKNFEESPIIQIGETWRLTSPLDLWANLSNLLTLKDFENFRECFLIAFKDGNPIIKPKDENDFEAIYNKKRKFSNWSREGLTQTLILISQFGKSLSIPNLTEPKLWVDNIIFELLNNKNGEMWISFDHELPLISEASPESFLKAINNSLAKEQPEILDMFKEEDGVLHKTSHYTGLLWALEGLAWLPEYLREVGLILLKLSRLDPGGSLSNRPINSLTEIFKPWHYQTLASYDERMEILKFITEKEKESGWMLLLRMLPEDHGIAHSTHKMRWRIFEKNTNLSYTYQEVWNTHTYVIVLLLGLFDNDENKFSQIIDETTNLSPNDRKIVLDWADITYGKVDQKKFITRETIRGILSRHRSYPDATWALPETELIRLENLYNNLKPNDVVNKYIWLFNNHWPEFIDGFGDNNKDSENKHDEQQQRIDNARSEAASFFLKELGLKKTLELRKSIKEPWTLGDALARVVTNEEDVLTICESLNDSKEYLGFADRFIYRKSIIEGIDWIINLVKSLQQKGFNAKAISKLLTSIIQNQQVWDFVSSLDEEVQNNYWQNIYPIFHNISVDEKIFGVEMLMKHKRFFTAIDVCSSFTDIMPTKILTDLLQKALIEEGSEKPHFRQYELQRIFETLDTRNNVERSTMINLEWLYIPFLDSYGTRRSPKLLEEELAKNPEFFIDVLKLVYIPKDKIKLKDEKKGLSDEMIKNKAKQAYHLLHVWKRIPGMRDDNSIDKTELREWIIKVRTLAEEVSRLDVADMEIGKVLAQYPEEIPEWPQEKIFQIIEEINTDSLKRSYSSALFNKRSFSSRPAFAGGDIERDKAAYFKKLYNDFKNKYPNVAEIFKHMEQRYLRDAKGIDEDAEREKLDY